MQDRINRKRQEGRLIKNYLKSQPDGGMNAKKKWVLHITMMVGSTDWKLLDGGHERHIRGADDWRVGNIIKALYCKREGIIVYILFQTI